MFERLFGSYGTGKNLSNHKDSRYARLNAAQRDNLVKRFRRIANDAALDTNEIISTLVQQTRFDVADLFPESDFLQQAKRLGISLDQENKRSDK
jgi:hypothetical protein